MAIVSVNNAFTLSTSSTQTHTQRNWSNGNVSTHWYSDHLLTRPSPESQGPKPRGRAGSVTLAAEPYSHVTGHFWKEALWRPTPRTCRLPTSAAQEVALGLTCMSSCYEARGPASGNPAPGADVIWTELWSWWPAPHPGVVAALQLGFRLQGDHKGKRGRRIREKGKNACTFPLFH